jgi:uncharacterized protein
MRVASLDLLRGVAILGILPVNIAAFGLASVAYQNPLAMGPIGAADMWAWRIMHLLFDQRFMTIFCVMFGAGIALLAERPARPGTSAAGRHYRRMAWLLAIGMVHAYGIWYGDILANYAVCAMLIWPLRRLASGWLCAIASVLLIVPPLIMAGIALLMGFAPPEVASKMMMSWQPPPELLAGEIAAMRGSWLEQMPVRASNAALMQFGIFFMWALWRTTALMMLGIVLYRSGFLSAAWRARTYALLAIVASAIGLTLTGTGIVAAERAGFTGIAMVTTWMNWNYFGSLFGALGWASAIMLLAQAARPARMLAALEAVGRTSLSNYLLQSLTCTLIFNGHGLGWFGQLGRLQLWGVVIAVWALQIALTLLWMRVASVGPVEWAWRSLASWRVLPLWRGAPA